VRYDKLLIATGSDPFIIPVPGKDLPGVITFRDMDDVDHMLAAADRGGSAVVIGGGLLGLEAAHGLSLRGMTVTVLHLMPTLMERQLDEAAAWLLKSALEARGQTVLTGADTAEILGDGKVEAVRLKDGREIAADLVVMAVGIRPSTALAREAGLAVGRGIQVDDHMVTSDPDVLAVGECVEHDGQVYGLVAPLWDMCRALADGLVERPSGYRASVTSTKLKVAGLDVFSAGDFAGGDGCEDIVLRDASRGVYKRVVLKDDRVVGAVLYGDTADGGWYFDLMKRGEDISATRDLLIFGQAFASGGGQADPKAAVAALSDGAEICGCNGVSKGQVVSCIAKGAHSLDAVRSSCKASASCGSCTGLVETLLALTLGDQVEAGPKTMCKCTSFGHDDVRREIVAQGMRSIPEVMHKLHWSTPDGCSSCRPALNYYLLCALPGAYEDDQQSRFVNERLHANIQKDGTYSVVPRMWGGITSPQELRAIADVVEKYDAPMVKVTGGQRLDIFGIKKEDLPAVWADLNAAGMVSGHAYGKALRTVKTCVGSEWCRFGTQDSTGLGVKLERGFWGSWMPHKFKMAVSGCPRNCAEATIKDFGIVCVDSGYELHVGGNGGIHVRATDLLVKVATEEEAIHYAAAFVQLYRARRARPCPGPDRRGRGRPRRARRALLVFADVQPGGSLGRTRVGRGARTACAYGAFSTFGIGGRGMIGDWLDIGWLDQIPVRGSRTVTVSGGEEVAVFRTADNRVFALANRCPHKGGPLSQGIVHGHSVACPLHNWRIALATGEAQGEDKGCTPTIAVKVDAGRVLLCRSSTLKAAA
jgi:nitrite reductase (NADH) large subunit